MKLKLSVLLATFVVTMGLLLGTSAAQAATVKFDLNNPTQATGIENLDIGGTLYNVAFTATQTVAAQIYGPFPGTFDFATNQAAQAAADVVNEELNATGAKTVGAGGSDGVPFYRIGFESGVVGQEIEVVIFWESVKGDADLDPWLTNIEADGDGYNFGVRMWADFTLAGPAPPPVTIGGTVTGLEGSGLVLQNNGTDDLPMDSDGSFVFATPLIPGNFYNVTVATNPSNPAQTCSVTNGSSQVPTEDVTDVAVTCAEMVMGDVIKAAAEGEILPDGTVLTLILKDGGVAINKDGQVAFGGRDDDGTDAVFTQARKVTAEGETLPDSTVLSSFRAQGEVAISSVESGNKVAFHGQDDNNIVAVFTQAGVVVKEGDTLSVGSTLDEIEAEGKVAINNFDQVAFHGRVEIEGGLFDEQFRAVFISSNGQTTRVAAREASELPDGTTLEEILESGGVAINDFDEVAFHGRVVDPAAVSDTLKAVFTSDGLVARVASELPDGNTLDDINEDGGVAINLFGDVVFHGSIVNPAGSDSVKAVFTQAGVVVKEGDKLPDGTTVDEITVQSGVAINLFGDVVFHGRTGNVKAVFTQNGLVARVGDNLADGTTTLKEIWENAGVAINTYGFEVAFHGGVENPDIPGVLVDAVFVGQAP